MGEVLGYQWKRLTIIREVLVGLELSKFKDVDGYTWCKVMSQYAYAMQTKQLITWPYKYLVSSPVRHKHRVSRPRGQGRCPVTWWRHCSRCWARCWCWLGRQWRTAAPRAPRDSRRTMTPGCTTSAPAAWSVVVTSQINKKKHLIALRSDCLMS